MGPYPLFSAICPPPTYNSQTKVVFPKKQQPAQVDHHCIKGVADSLNSGISQWAFFSLVPVG